MKHNLINISLRFKLILTVTLAVIAVSCFILSFTIKMIINDKQAYLYDSVYQSLNTGSSALERFFSGKLTLIRLITPETKSPEEISAERLSVDKDHYQTLSIPMQGSWEERQIRTLVKNEKHLEYYKKRESFLDVDKDFLFTSAEEAKIRGSLEKLYFKEGHAPRFVFFIYNPGLDIVYYFDFLLDAIYSDNFDRQSLENKLVSASGEILFNNRSFEGKDPAQMAVFYRNFIKEQKGKHTTGDIAGVIEQDVNGENYIFGYKKLNAIAYSDYFIFSGVKTREAYQVTTNLALNTILYTLFLVGTFNLISIFVVKSITKPLELLTANVKLISEGKYDLKFEKQNTIEYQLLVDAFKEMVQKIQNYQNQLIEYNRTLELKVEERTRDLKQANDFIKTMVDSLAQGLVVFGRDGICLDLHTKASEVLIGENPTGKHLGDLVKAQDRDLFNVWVENLFDEMIPFESLVELGQKSIPCDKDYKSDDFKFVTLEYFPMRDEDNQIKNVVLVASDETREFKAKKEVEAQQNFVKLVTKVLKDKNNFIRFHHMFNELLAKEKAYILSNGLENRDDFMRLIHSMKGSAAFYSLQDVVNYLHHFESDLLNGKMEVSEIINRIDNSINKMEKSLESLGEFIGNSSSDAVEIEEKKLRAFEFKLRKISPTLGKKFREQFLDKEVHYYIDNYITLVVDLSLKLNKSINPIVVENGDLLVDRNIYQEFFDSCIHLFRNVVDHGIELPEVRSSLGKDERGNIKVSFSIINAGENSFLSFSVQDDGGGIDPERIRKKMRQLDYPEEIIAKKDDQIIYHIFDANFSTAENITDISGRGVGLYDIKKNVEKLQGAIELESRIGKGTLFSFLLPLPG